MRSLFSINTNTFAICPFRGLDDRGYPKRCLTRCAHCIKGSKVQARPKGENVFKAFDGYQCDLSNVEMETMYLCEVEETSYDE